MENNRRVKELRELLNSIEDVYDDFISGILAYAKRKTLRLDIVIDFIKKNPNAKSSDVVFYISSQPDFFDDGVDNISDSLMKITREHDYGSAFWLQPVHVEDVERIRYEHVQDSENEISIRLEDFDGLLKYFFVKYFDSDLKYNKHRYSLDMNPTGRSKRFEYYLEHNFYTVEQMELLLSDIEEVVSFIENQQIDRIPIKLLDSVNIYFNRHFNLRVITYDVYKDMLSEYYLSFVGEVRRMMKECLEYSLFNMMGP